MLKRRSAVLFLLTLVTVYFSQFFNPSITQSRQLSQFSTPTVQTRYRYYPITGATAADLRSQMAKLGPIDRSEGRRYDANTDWTVKWTYRFARSPHQCRVRSASSNVSVLFTLPRWKAPAQVERSLLTDWQRYLIALQTHEDGHKDNGIAASNDILQTLRQLPAAASCQELEKTIQTATRRVIYHYNQKDIHYDRTTQHGSTQGAIFPTIATVSR